MSDYLKKLFIDEAKAVLLTGSVGGSGSGGDVSDSDVATDEEAGDVIDDIFNTGTDDAGTDPGTGAESGETGDEIATDEEAGDVIDDVFG